MVEAQSSTISLRFPLYSRKQWATSFYRDVSPEGRNTPVDHSAPFRNGGFGRNLRNRPKPSAVGQHKPRYEVSP